MDSLLGYARRAGIEGDQLRAVVFHDPDHSAPALAYGPAAAAVAAHWQGTASTDAPPDADGHLFTLVPGDRQGLESGWVAFVNTGSLRAIVYRKEEEGAQAYHIYGRDDVMVALQNMHDDGEIPNMSNEPLEGWPYDPRVHRGEAEQAVMLGLHGGGYLIYIDGHVPGYEDPLPPKSIE